MPRAAHAITGSTATRVPTGDVAAAPGLDDPSRDLVAEQERERPEAARARAPQLGRLPNRCRSLPQMPPTVTATRAHSLVRELRLVDLDQLRAERRILQVELDCAHAVIFDDFPL